MHRKQVIANESSPVAGTGAIPARIRIPARFAPASGRFLLQGGRISNERKYKIHADSQYGTEILRTLRNHLASPHRQPANPMSTMRQGGSTSSRGSFCFFFAALDPLPRGGASVMKSLQNPSLHLVSGSRRTPDDAAIMAAYRPYTRALLRRYFRMAVDIGRLPSILGGLCFRARVSSYKLHTFEDAVIFVHDIERVFERLERHSMEIIAGVTLLEYSLPEAALRLGITVQRAERRYASALDSLSAILLQVGLLRPVFTSGGEHAPDDPPGAAEPLPPRKPPLPVRIAAQAPFHCQASGAEMS
jgi:hypothetical protein